MSDINLFAAPVATMPALPSLTLTDSEAAIMNGLATRLFEMRSPLELSNLYYDGGQKMQDLGISIPPSLHKLRTVIGWPRIGVDALSNRCRVEGFRYPGVSSIDDDLAEIWQANKLDGEAQLAHLDALIYGRSYLVVGPSPKPGAPPLITAESPINLIAAWDARTRQCTAAVQIYVDSDFSSDTYGQEVAALYLPDSTVWLARTPAPAGMASATARSWTVTDRNTHDLGQVPVVRMANRCRTANRDGMSEVTTEWRNTTDSACRTLLGMEIAREFYGAPRRYVLGASEESFKRPDGTSVTAWDTYMSKLWAVERDEDDNLPTVGEFKAADPSTHTKLITQYAQIMSGEMGVPPHFLGIFSDGNPASADAIRSGYEELTIRARNKHTHFSDGWEETLRLALQIRDGKLPAGALQMETDWADPAPATPASTVNALYQLIQGGAIPPTSDVTLKHAGFTASERARLTEDREKDQAASFLAEIAKSLVAKDARVDNSLSADISNPGTAPGSPPTPALPAATGPAIPKRTPFAPPSVNGA